jgi:ribosome-associated heat shock protein Hsp15
MNDAPAEHDLSGAAIRLDKWLWHARFLKSRSLATKLAQSGKIRLNGETTGKAHQAVRPGDVLTFPLGPHIRVIRVLAPGARRGPAPEARTLYDDLDPPRPRPSEDRPAAAARREPGAGRPTKTDRRAIDKLMGRGGADGDNG